MKSKSDRKQVIARRGADASQANQRSFLKTAESLAEIGRGFCARGWVLGTSGNFSAVVSREPLRLAITSTGVDKGSLAAEHILEMDDAAGVVRGAGRPSAEALLHVAIVRGLGAGA